MDPRLTKLKKRRVVSSLPTKVVGLHEIETAIYNYFHWRIQYLQQITQKYDDDTTIFDENEDGEFDKEEELLLLLAYEEIVTILERAITDQSLLLQEEPIIIISTEKPLPELYKVWNNNKKNPMMTTITTKNKQNPYQHHGIKPAPSSNNTSPLVTPPTVAATTFSVVATTAAAKASNRTTTSLSTTITAVAVAPPPPLLLGQPQPTTTTEQPMLVDTPTIDATTDETATPIAAVPPAPHDDTDKDVTISTDDHAAAAAALYEQPLLSLSPSGHSIVPPPENVTTTTAKDHPEQQQQQQQQNHQYHSVHELIEILDDTDDPDIVPTASDKLEEEETRKELAMRSDHRHEVVEEKKDMYESNYSTINNDIPNDIPNNNSNTNLDNTAATVTADVVTPAAAATYTESTITTNNTMTTETILNDVAAVHDAHMQVRDSLEEYMDYDDDHLDGDAGYIINATNEPDDDDEFLDDDDTKEDYKVEEILSDDDVDDDNDDDVDDEDDGMSSSSSSLSSVSTSATPVKKKAPATKTTPEVPDAILQPPSPEVVKLATVLRRQPAAAAEAAAPQPVPTRQAKTRSSTPVASTRHTRSRSPPPGRSLRSTPAAPMGRTPVHHKRELLNLTSSMKNIATTLRENKSTTKRTRRLHPKLVSMKSVMPLVRKKPPPRKIVSHPTKKRKVNNKSRSTTYVHPAHDENHEEGEGENVHDDEGEQNEEKQSTTGKQKSLDKGDDDEQQEQQQEQVQENVLFLDRQQAPQTEPKNADAKPRKSRKNETEPQQQEKENDQQNESDQHQVEMSENQAKASPQSENGESTKRKRGRKPGKSKDTEPIINEKVKQVKERYKKKLEKLKEEKKKIKEAIKEKRLKQRLAKENKARKNMRWEDRYEQLVQYYNEHGHTNINRYRNNHNYDQMLYYWVAYQRKLYRDNAKGLTQERINKLNAIEFNWTVKHNRKSFDERVEECKQHLAEHGHLRVPDISPDDVEKTANLSEAENSFRLWVATVRSQYSKRFSEKGIASSKLSKTRISQLDALGFAWTMEDETAEGGEANGESTPGKTKSPATPSSTAKRPDMWTIRYEQLKKVKELYGDCNNKHHVMAVYPDNPSVYDWVRAQRKQWNNWKKGRVSQLTAERRELLRELDFNFDPRNLLPKYYACLKEKQQNQEQQEDDEEQDEEEEEDTPESHPIIDDVGETVAWETNETNDTNDNDNESTDTEPDPDTTDPLESLVNAAFASSAVPTATTTTVHDGWHQSVEVPDEELVEVDVQVEVQDEHDVHGDAPDEIINYSVETSNHHHDNSTREVVFHDDRYDGYKNSNRFHDGERYGRRYGV